MGFCPFFFRWGKISLIILIAIGVFVTHITITFEKSANSLKDFDDVKLLPASRKLKNLI